MDLIKEISSAFQFVTLLSVLFWSFNWNLPSDYDPFQEVVGKYPKTKRQRDAEVLIESSSKEISETLKKLGTAQRTSQDSSKILLPSFYAWKKEELIKQEATTLDGKKNKFVPTSSRRKLNFASSKCGAKILSSNAEASYKTAILNENFEEYMLNPCRANIWFVIELCDTIEATQIELANYELYSSSPKHFSVLWSNIYPPQQWSQLGSFEAKDVKTMQTYNLTAHNYGKFLKVVILSHYGKEHFCPISVLRVLGYSMIYEYEDLEVENKSSHKAVINPKSQRNQSDFTTLIAKNVQPSSSKAKYFNSWKSFNGLSKSSKRFCRKGNEGFLKRISPKGKEMKCILKTENYNLIRSKKTLGGRNLIKFGSKLDGNLPKYFGRFKEILSKYTKTCPFNATNSSISDLNYRETFDRAFQYSSSFTKNSPFNRQSSLNTKNNKSHSETETKTSPHQRKLLKENSARDGQKTCLCDESSSSLQDVVSSHTKAQSAALIQKESVITKLTNRIKDSEVNLNLVNQYLQQLSESYRQEMESMHSLLNVTLKAVREAEKKSTLTVQRRQVSIRSMAKKLSRLQHKVEYFIDGHQHLLKRVMELHGLFLVLEFIVISTIFSLFINNFKQKIINTCRKFDPRYEEYTLYRRN